MSQNNLEAIQALCAAKGVPIEVKQNGHVQIKGPLLVNYYPLSKSLTAYVAGTKQGAKGCTPEAALEMAFSPPKRIAEPVKRRKNNKHLRIRMLMKKPFCMWCNAPLTLETSTLEHIIPLARGGLDHSNNRGLACPKCNHDRGSEMPELTNI